MRSALLLILCWWCASPLRGADLDGPNQLYDQGKYAEAKAGYEKLLGAGEWSANLFYNLGNTHHRLGAPGAAILEYRRALALDGDHPEAQNNLNFLRQQTGAVVWPRSWQDELFPPRWTTAFAIVGALAGWAVVLALTALFVFARGSKAGLWTVVGVALLVAGYAVAGVWHAEQERSLAIVTAQSVAAHAAPAESSASGAILPAGSEVRVLSVRGEWIYCALPGEGRGWISAKALERVRLGAS